MYIKKQGLKLAVKGLVSGGASLLAIMASSAQAQNVPTESKDELALAKVGEADAIIVVTGSRISRQAGATAYPVSQLDVDEIEKSGKTSLSELLRETPALFGSDSNALVSGQEAAFGGAGRNTLNLRNLRANRTLVLVNSRRHIGSVGGQQAVDINSIPIGLVDHVDVMTGGASAVYGADGVSGVVNIVMKNGVKGAQAYAQQGISEYGDAPETLMGVVAGSDFAGQRGNITLAYEYRKQGSFSRADRPLNSRLVPNSADFGDDPTVPDNIFVDDARFAYTSPNAVVSTNPFAAPQFSGTGALFDPGAFVGSFDFVQGGDGTNASTFGGDLQAKLVSHNVNALFDFELSDNLRFFAEGKYVSSRSYSEGQPSSEFGVFLFGDNPFIPQAIANDIAFGGVFLYRDNFDLGRSSESNKSNLYRSVVGFEGALTDTIDFNVSYVYGHNKMKIVTGNAVIADRYYAAIDVVDFGGGPECAIDVFGGAAQTFTPGPNSGCVPLNLFGNGSPSEAAIDFVTTDLTSKLALTHHVVNGYISGDFGGKFGLGGPISYVLGAEYRKESSRFSPDPLFNQNALLDYGVIPAEQGSYDVVEGFAEVRVPIALDESWARRLELGGALRVSDYSTVGSSVSWKLDAVWTPVSMVTLRGSYGRAVRAPNINELFGPSVGVFDQLRDPCSISTPSNGSANRVANCATLLSGLGVDPASFNVDYPSGVAGNGIGNPDLSEEKADSWTAGIIFTPKAISGLTVSVDWYDISIKNAININNLQEIANYCVDGVQLNSSFCNQIVRGSDGAVTGFTFSPQNVANIETSGADIALDYRFAAGEVGQFHVRGALGYLSTLSFTPADGAARNDNRGERGAPKWTGSADITWQKGGFGLNYGVQYIGKQLRFDNADYAANPDIAPAGGIYFKSALIHDAQLDFTTENNGYSFYLGVNNFTDVKPDRGATYTPVSAVGRYYYAGVRFDLDGLGF